MSKSLIACAAAVAWVIAPCLVRAEAAAVSVNGVDVPASLVEARERWTGGEARMFSHGRVDEQALRTAALRFAVEAELARQELSRRGLEVAPQEVDADIEASRARQGAERAGLLRMHGVDESSARQLRRAELNRERYARLWAEASGPVREADIEGYYRKNYAIYHVPERVRLEYMTLIAANVHDLRPTTDMRAVIEELRHLVTQGGRSFQAAAAAAQYPYVKVTAADGLFPVDGVSYQAWEPALRGLKDGAVSPVLYLGRNVYIILRPLGRVPAVNRSLDEVRDEIRATVLPIRLKEVADERFEELVRAAKLVFPDPRYPALETAAP